MTKEKKVRNEMKKVVGLRAPQPTKRVRSLLMTTIVLVSVVAMLIVGSKSVLALDPHVVTGFVYEVNGTTVPSGSNVTVTNVRTGESKNTTVNATGVYAYNLLNLPSGWAYGDTIQIIGENATYATGTNSTQLLIGAVRTGIDVWIGTTTRTAGVNFYIVDNDGYEVSNAMINLKDSNGDIVTTKLSDSDGKASTTLDDGLYTVTVSKSGYDDVTETLQVHGCDYTITLGEEEDAAAVAISDWLWWTLIAFACIGIVALILYAIRKV